MSSSPKKMITISIAVSVPLSPDRFSLSVFFFLRPVPQSSSSSDVSFPVLRWWWWW